MPRLSNSLIRHSSKKSPLLPLLLQTCRNLPSARNELRWLKEHIDECLSSRFGDAKDVPSDLRHKCLATLVQRRAQGTPLQYLLGTQPFGELEILCKQGVLIPRLCTEAYTERLARLLRESYVTGRKQESEGEERHIRILDFCTGTGCIPLLLTSLLSPHIPVQAAGIDISPQALALSARNLRHNFPSLSPNTDIRFEYGDVLLNTVEAAQESLQAEESRNWWYGDHEWDVVTANPPYISQHGFNKDTERSVRNFEPKLALVPEAAESVSADKHPEDIFYPAITIKAEALKAKVLLMEVAGTEQALRVAHIIKEDGDGYWRRVEIWADDPDAELGHKTLPGNVKKQLHELQVQFRGAGAGRSVVCWRD